MNGERLGVSGERSAVYDQTAANGLAYDPQDDLLWRQLKSIPAFRALLRAVEARFYQHIELPGPVLDVGCGDGHFAQMTFPGRLAAGIDPWWGPLQKARRTDKYDVLVRSMGDHLPFPDASFASAFSNSVLEHIPDVQPVLNEVGRVLQPGGRFVITTPSHLFTEWLGGAGFFERLGLSGLADRYRDFFNTISRHAHTDPPDVWARRLAEAGFVIERWQYYFSREALHALEIGHVQGLPSAVLHALTGHWILGPWESNLRPTERWVRPYYEEAPSPEGGAYLLFIARRVSADDPRLQTTNPLPPPNPFVFAPSPTPTATPASATESNGAAVSPSIAVQTDVQSTAAVRAEPQPAVTVPTRSTTIPPQPAPVVPAPYPAPTTRRPASSRTLSAGLAILALLLAAIGQSLWRSTPEMPTAGLWWFVLSGLSLVAAVRAARPSGLGLRRPSWGINPIPRSRWLLLPALLLSLMAAGQANGPLETQRPGFAILLWLAAGGLAFVGGVWPLPQGIGNWRFEIGRVREWGRAGLRRWPGIAAVLFLVALLLRAFSLSSIPAIFNGTEANIGLDVQAVVNGFIRNPFGSGWLTNPTLPLFLLSLPLRLFGPSVLAVRFWSPLIGALTIVAVLLIGWRLWRREVGIGAAVLLTGAHYHLHYSRLGLTNIWDPLFTLLALGLIAIAWETAATSAYKRPLWALAGIATGLNAYFFTSSHLLPMMLVGLALLLLVFHFQRVRQEAIHIFIAAAVALIIALPQLLYYNANPAVFMERANSLGILDSHSGWLSQEALRSGLSQSELFTRQFWRAALAFNATRDTSTAYGPPSPLLGWGMGVLAVLGFFFALLHGRQPRYAILVIWTAVTILFAGVLLENPPSSHRLLIAMPALMLLAAIALFEIVRAVVRALSLRSATATAATAAATTNTRLTARHFLLPVVAIAAALALLDLAFYFGTYQSQHRFGDRNTEVAGRMAEYLNELDSSAANWTAYFYGPPAMYVSFPTLAFLTPQFQPGLNLFDVEPDAGPLPAATAPNQVYIFLPERQSELLALQAQAPNGRLQTFDGYYSRPLFFAYEIGD